MNNRLRSNLKDALYSGGVFTSAASVGGMIFAASAALAQPPESHIGFRQQIEHSTAKCSTGAGPAVLVTINNIKSSSGTVRVQSYRGIKEEWLKKGKWINRIELPAEAGSMTVCMPIPVSGIYGIAVRHDINGNGKTEISQDGGAMSNNPSINIFNLGKPSYKKTRFQVGSGVQKISINMRYM